MVIRQGEEEKVMEAGAAPPQIHRRARTITYPKQTDEREHSLPHSHTGTGLLSIWQLMNPTGGVNTSSSSLYDQVIFRLLRLRQACERAALKRTQTLREQERGRERKTERERERHFCTRLV